MNNRILAFGCTHFPYQHVDALDFIAALLRSLKPDRVVHMGDEVDMHAMSFHEHNPNLPSAKDETDLAAAYVQDLYELVPRLDLLESNHGSLHLRKSIAAGIPNRFVRSYNDAWEVGKGWRWHDDLTLDTPMGAVYFHHGKRSNVLAASKEESMSMVQAHYHTKMGAQFWGNSRNLYFAAQTGCLIDRKKLAFAYGRNAVTKPLLGALLIEEGKPIVVPMLLNRRGRWDRQI